MAILNSTKVNGQLEADAIVAKAISGSNTALFVSGNATIQGDLEITGDLTYVGSKDIRVEDKVIEIAYVEEKPVTPSEADGAGIVIGRDNDENCIASIKYQYNGGGDSERISIDKKIAGSIENADHADKAAQLDNALVFGNGITATKTSFDGSEAVEISVSADVNVKHAEYADSASKLDHTLIIKGDGVEEVVFDGSANKEVTLNLSHYQTVASASASAASQAVINANLLESASVAESSSKVYADQQISASAASQAVINASLLASASAVGQTASKALSEYSASQATVNSGVSSSIEGLGQRIDTVTGSLNSFSSSVAKSFEDANANITALSSGSTKALEDYKDQVAPYIAHVSASSSAWDNSLSEAKNYANTVSASLRTDFANADANVLASMSVAIESASVVDQKHAADVSETAALRAIASASALVADLDYTSEVVANEYVAAVNQEDGKVSVEKAAIPVIGVVTGDKIVTVSNRELQTELSIEYNSDDRHVYLKGINGVEVSRFDASAFVKDGILYGTALIEATATIQEVTIKEQTKELSGLEVGKAYMVFCFTSGAAVNPEYSWEVLDVTELVDVYTGGNGISIDSNVVSVKLAEGTNYVKVKEGGALAVDSINAQHTILSGSIQVAGGPLADDTSNDWPTDWKDEAGNKIIPSNLSVHQVLEGLFLKVINGTVTKKAATTWNPKNTAPTATISQTNVPVGTEVTVSYSANQGVTANSRSIEVTATQGHFLNDGTSWVSGSYKQSKTGSTTGTATVTATFSGSAVSSGATVQVNPGTSSLVVTQTGITASIAKFDDATIYASTNTKVKLTSSVSIHEDAAPTSKPIGNTATANVTGYFPIYNGQLADTNMADASWTVDKIKSGNVTASSVPTQVEITSGKATYFIAIPEGHAYYNKTVFNVEATSDKSPFGKGKITPAIAVPMLNDWGNKNYRVFYISNASAQSANNTFNITFA